MEWITRAVDAIKVFEGFRSKAYKDQAGNWTVGYGQLVSNDGVTVTEEQASAAVRDRVESVARRFEGIFAELGDGQKAALASFIYNVGEGAFGGSTLKKYVMAGDYLDAGLEMLKWCHYRTKDGRIAVSDGLFNRRKQEAKMLWGEV